MHNKPAVHRFIRRLVIVACLCAASLFSATTQAADMAENPDIVIRISRLNEALSIMDEVAEGMSAKIEQPPSAILGGMLMGTHWIDANRSVVIGGSFKAGANGASPEMAALIPFTQPNENFKQAYNAIQRADYYVIPLPPGKPTAVPQSLEAGLAQSADKLGDRFISADVSVRQMLKKAEPQIQQMLTTLERKMDQQPLEMPKDISDDKARSIIENLLDLARQMETFSVGFDLTRNDISFFLALLAETDTDLAGLMTGEGAPYPSKLGNYAPSSDLQMRFRSRPFDMEASMNFVQTYFGEIYAAMGIDLESGMGVFSQFTGETVGAMAMSPDAIELEAIGVLKPDMKRPADFLESDYLPWMVDTGKEMAKFYNEQYADLNLDSVFVRSDSTIISENNVIGVLGKLPVMNPATGKIDLMSMPIRMTIVDDYMLMASSDARMSRLIKSASSLKPAGTSDAPLMQMNMNLGELMKSALATSPASLDMKQSPELGDLSYIVDVKDRQMTAEYRLQVSDIKSLGTYLAAFQPVNAGTGEAMKSDREVMPHEEKWAEQPTETRPSPQPKPLTEDDARYWIDKGGLYAAYGNQKAAVRHFKKAIALDAGNSDAHFNLALAYGEMGNHEAALKAVSRAIALSPDNGSYIYGRGWIHLRAGNNEEALADMRRAAELGNADAAKYLDRIAPRMAR